MAFLFFGGENGDEIPCSALKDLPFGIFQMARLVPTLTLSLPFTGTLEPYYVLRKYGGGCMKREGDKIGSMQLNYYLIRKG